MTEQLRLGHRLVSLKASMVCHSGLQQLPLFYNLTMSGSNPDYNSNPNPVRAVILLSGGLDSTTMLAMAAARSRHIYALSFSYHQRHQAELEYATRQARRYHAIRHEILDLEPWGRILAPATALVQNSKLAVPQVSPPSGSTQSDKIPVTYVPARNTLFLSVALGFAEVVEAQEIWIGVNAVDYSGYPDCRPSFVDAFERLANLATKRAIEGQPFVIESPLIGLGKHEIIQKGLALGVQYQDTLSCYHPSMDTADATKIKACGRCDSCSLRLEGFARAGATDPLEYM